jgi:aspartyl-tRNA synthetase
MLLARGAALGVDLKPIKDYVDSFSYGAHPHAGGGVGKPFPPQPILARKQI